MALSRAKLQFQKGPGDMEKGEYPARGHCPNKDNRQGKYEKGFEALNSNEAAN